MVHETEYASIYKTEYAKLVGWIMMRGIARDDALDFAQEAFLRVWAKGGEVTNPRAYLREIVNNLLKDSFKHADIVSGCDETLLPKPVTPPTPHEVLECSELTKVIEATLVHMAAGSAEALLRYMEGASVTEIARERGTASATIYAQLHKARMAINHAIRHLTKTGSSKTPSDNMR